MKKLSKNKLGYGKFNLTNLIVNQYPNKNSRAVGSTLL